MIRQKNKIAAVQMASSPNLGANLQEAKRLIAEAARLGAQLVVLPENFAFMGKHERDLLDHREEEGGGPLQEFLSQTARRHGLWLVGGTIPMRARVEDKVRAACLVFDDQGRQVGRYDKIHLFDVHLLQTDEHYTESAVIESGSRTLTLETPFGRLGLAICYDLRFPELFRRLLDDGVELIAMPAAFTAVTGKAHWEVLLRARAIENLSYFVAAAQGGYHRSGRQTFGHSMVVDPWGNVLAKLARGAGVVCVEYDPDCLRNIRRAFPTIDHRRLT